MPSTQFLSDIYNLSFDVLKLRAKYKRAYSSIIIRMAELLNRRQPFFAAIFERPFDKNVGFPDYYDPDINEFQCTYFIKTNHIKKPRRRVRLLWCMLPRKWNKRTKKSCLIKNGSVAASVVRNNKSVYVENVTGFDFFHEDDFTVLGRPVYWRTRLAKIIVIGVPAKDKYLLNEQVQRIRPKTFNHSFQLI